MTTTWYVRWRERIRWRIAYLADKLPGQCWSDLVSWALGYDTDYRTRLPWRPSGRCRKEPEGCYCGKWQGPLGRRRT